MTPRDTLPSRVEKLRRPARPFPPDARAAEPAAHSVDGGGTWSELPGLRDVRVAVAPLLEVGAQVLGLDATVAIALAPVAQVGIAQAASGGAGCQAGDQAVLGDPFGPQGLDHEKPFLDYPMTCGVADRRAPAPVKFDKIRALIS